jgi:hypothetical protein
MTKDYERIYERNPLFKTTRGFLSIDSLVILNHPTSPNSFQIF